MKTAKITVYNSKREVIATIKCPYKERYDIMARISRDYPEATSVHSESE